ncbi:MAG: tyrosine-type recombinase/integrase [Chthonomonadetes bacterium]|nr:tyrosine-type recombinase/integrase [Chthonomonadetes bacterium]
MKRERLARLPLVRLIDEFLTYQELYRRPKTVEHTRYGLSIFLKFCQTAGVAQLREIDAVHVQRYLLYLKQKYANPSTAWSITCDFRAFQSWLVENGYLTKPWLERFPPRPKPLPRPLGPEDVKRILDATEGKDWLTARNRAIIITLLETGLRRGELLQMKVCHVRNRGGFVYQKGERPHSFILSRQALLAIKRYQNLAMEQAGVTFEDDESPLWYGARGPLTASGLQIALRKIGKSIGVRLWAHRLRATCATARLESGASTELVRSLLGHVDPESIRSYVAIVNERLRDQIEATSPLKWVENQSGKRKRGNR